MIPIDKAKHFMICAAVAMCMMVLMRIINTLPTVAFLASIMCSIALGAGKEYGDSCNPYNIWDWKDFLADIIGGFIGSIFGLLLWV